MSSTEIRGEAGPAQGSDAASGPARPLAAAPSAIHDPATSAGRLGLAFKRAMVAVRRLRGRETSRPGADQLRPGTGCSSGCPGLYECSARQLADHADLTAATVTQMLEHLEAAGLVKRTRSQADRRVVISALTERGEMGRGPNAELQMEPRWLEALSGVHR